MIEIEQQRGHDLAALDAPQRILEPLVEQHAIGQARQRVVQRHVGDLGLGLALLGDVVMRGHGAAVGHRLGGHGDVAAIAQLVGILGHSLPGDALDPVSEQLVGALAPEFTLGDAMLDDLAQCRAGFHLLGRQPVHLGIALVAHDEPLLAVVHGQALQHVVEGGIELDILVRQLLLLRLEQHVLLLEARIQPLALGDVLVRYDAAAAGQSPTRHVDDATVRQLLDARRYVPEVASPTSQEALGVLDVIVPVGKAIFEHLPQRGAGRNLFGGQSVHLGIAAVADDEPLLRVVHGQTLQHVIHGRIELLVALIEFMLALFQELVLPGQLGIELLALGDVLVRA